ncbi:putative porin [Paraburkholderia sp. GV068]|uniref:porin n=1 Tax=unclassified Paraburkholderia TaxID=2615204 RepID=UPI000D31021C|nr:MULTISPECIES: porin [unclassified Paraburkholderia]PTQ92083.1 putative porin [Paraburkholderia sp. GV072]PUA94293.1 putative porin [Paraburkholderia sp. GV068]
MKKAWQASAAILAVAVASTATAQSSVTVYGIVDDGVGWTSNQGGHSNVQMLSGYMQGNRLGFLGHEDLGAGSSAVFRLESGFDNNTGTLSQGGRLFGRSAYVGVENKSYGTVTLGRQYDTNYDLLALYQFAKYWGSNGVLIGDNDNLFGTVRFSNSVKYTSPNIGGFNVSAMYAMSNVPSFEDNRAYSVTGRFEHGGLSVGAGFLQMDHPNPTDNPNGAAGNDYPAAFSFFKGSLLSPTTGVRRQQIFLSGGTYNFGKAQIGVLYSHVNYRYLDGTSLHLNNYEISGEYFITPALIAGLGYYYTNGAYSSPDVSPHWNQVDAGLDYLLSKRTDLYFYGVYQRAGAGARQAGIFLIPVSSSRQQTLVSAGIRHAF